jgi:predicted O-linked N-acetylglucosamine transferase (SPINDLY family)
MRNFKTILNTLAINSSYASQYDPCCEALSYLMYYDFKKFHITIENLNIAEKIVKVSEFLIRHLEKIINSYCKCLQTPLSSNQRSRECRKKVKEFLESGKFTPSSQEVALESRFFKILKMVFLAFKEAAIRHLSEIGIVINNDDQFISRFCDLKVNNANLLKDVLRKIFGFLDEANIYPEI